MKRKQLKIRPSIESPTWGDVQQMAASVIERLGGPSGAAQALNARSFYTLSILASLMLDEKKESAFILGKQYLT